MDSMRRMSSQAGCVRAHMCACTHVRTAQSQACKAHQHTADTTQHSPRASEPQPDVHHERSSTSQSAVIVGMQMDAPHPGAKTAALAATGRHSGACVSAAHDTNYYLRHKRLSLGKPMHTVLGLVTPLLATLCKLQSANCRHTNRPVATTSGLGPTYALQEPHHTKPCRSRPAVAAADRAAGGTGRCTGLPSCNRCTAPAPTRQRTDTHTHTGNRSQERSQG